MILSILECPVHKRVGIISITRHPTGHQLWRTKWDCNGAERSGVGRPEKQACGKPGCRRILRFWAGLGRAMEQMG